MLKAKKISIFTTIVILLVGLTFLFAFSDKYFSIVTIKSDVYLFEIKSANEWEVSKPIYCLVIKDNNIIVPLHLIGTTIENIDELDFAIIEDNQDGLFFVIEESAPYVVLAVFDFKEQKYWPFRSPNQTTQESYSNGEKLINQLNRDKKRRELYVLGSDVPGNKNIKVTP